MKLYLKAFLIGSIAAATACTSSEYKVTAVFPDSSNDGKTVYLINYDTADTIASGVVDSTTVVINGIIEEPVAANLQIDRGRKLIVLEPGEITVDVDGNVAGTALNDSLTNFMANLQNVAATVQEQYADSESLYDEMEAAIQQQMKQLYENNLNNPLGYLGFITMAGNAAPGELDSLIAQAPENYGNYKRVQELVEKAKNIEATAEGKMFVDFSVTSADGVTTKLSDFVGKGKPCIVDFWASWCGPCRGEIPNLKAIKEKHGDKIDILGVAVWDEPEATAKAIEELGITWPQIINAQSIPTELYGIDAIPHIIIIDGDGTIVSRGLRDEALAAKADELVNR